MTRRIQDEVAKNSIGRRRIEARTVEVSSDAARRRTFGGLTIEGEADVTVETRPLGGSLVMGHPSAANGMGRGAMGDNRGGWTERVSTSMTAELTKGGRGTVVDALHGARNAMAALLIGSGTAAASTRDSSLGSPDGRSASWGARSGNTAESSTTLRFSQFGPTVAEFGVENVDGDLMARAVIDSMSPSDGVEIRATMGITFTGSTPGDSVITDEGEQAAAQSIVSSAEVMGLYELAVGENGTEPSETDTALNSEVSRKRVTRDKRAESVRATTRWYESEPAEQPVDLDSIGLFDLDGRLVWLGPMDPVTKDSTAPLEAAATIRVI